jgi:hypothetical protein
MLFLVLFEVTPMTNITTDALPVYNTIGSSIDNTAATANAGSLLYQLKDSDEHNIGLVGVSMGTSHDRRSSSFGKNNNNDFDLKRASNITGTSTSSDSSADSSKLIHSSFRIEQDVIKSLEKVATRRDLSLSALVNRILKNYVTSEMYFEELGFLLVSKNFLRRTFEVLDKSILKIWKEIWVNNSKRICIILLSTSK